MKTKKVVRKIFDTLNYSKKLKMEANLKLLLSQQGDSYKEWNYGY